MTKGKKGAKRIINRFSTVAAALILQIAFIFMLSTRFSDASMPVNIIVRAFSLFILCVMLNQSSNPAMKLAWMAFILLLPIFGSMLYVLTGGKRPAKKLREAYADVQNSQCDFVPKSTEAENELYEKSRSAHSQSTYLKNMGFPVYNSTNAQYFPLGDDAFPVMLEELEKAQRYIFLEYFIIAPGEMHDRLLDVLERKAKSGVEVRMLYDDVGSLFCLDYEYAKELEDKGIKCHAFNPFVPFLSVVMNNRDHRKILVIDGAVAFTGGINIADEYINRVERFGIWKDNAAVIRGAGAWGFTLLFLNMWNTCRHEDRDLSKFYPHNLQKLPYCGFVQPFGDTPVNGELIAENAYMNAINAAQRYIYLYTPYLIPDNEMTTALCLAAKKGVDVRLIVPGIPDKKVIYAMTKSYYGELINSGVKIYKYNPGFVHAKGFVSDDFVACAGTVNIDFRSFYHHFECGCMFYDSPIVGQIKEDFLKTIEQSERIIKYQRFDGVFGNTYHAIIRLIAPLV